ncbi:DUF6375 family protein, partial [Streptomyces cellulosae]
TSQSTPNRKALTRSRSLGRDLSHRSQPPRTEQLAEAAWSDDDWRSSDERMPPELGEALREMKLYDMGRYDVDNYAFDHSVTREGETVRIWTDESDVQGFLKVLLHYGAKVEVFSRHEWDEDAITRSDASNRSDGGSD